MNRARKIIRWSLLAVTVLFLISGFGITQFRVVETLSFGLLTKPLSFRMHEYLWIPFIVLLAIHVFMSSITKLFRSNKDAGTKK